MKTKEELNALKEEVEALSKKLAELSEDELKQVSGGLEFEPVKEDTLKGKYDNGEDRRRNLVTEYPSVKNEVNIRLGYDKRYNET